MGGCNSCSLSFKALFGTLVVLGFILVGTLQSEGNKTSAKTTLRIVDDEDDRSWSGKGKLLPQREQQVKDLGKGKSGLVHQRMDLNYMSKRRVPNGPDPIHNRRAGNSGRPPRHT
ncbi:CLAVATA3/ESR-RELATED 26 [Hibiscus trionum]|uniref:CLAVATA3/ESR-RELATED 26 n=1 Tax=Hibiscus trionum TaxID=183268 RepID=A0A9W7JG58_HIBTR|nr:CLAVATA3/ESR-RELATED 26 [Hibiscus trionum]